MRQRWRVTPFFLPLLPFLAVLQSGEPDSHPLFPASARPARELVLVTRPEGLSARTLTVTLAAAGGQLQMQAVLVPVAFGRAESPQDQVFSLHPQRDGNGPLPLTALLRQEGGRRA